MAVNQGDLSNIMPKILARGLSVLRERCIMPRLVNADYSADAAEKGDTIDVPIPTAVSTANVAPSSTDVAGTTMNPTKVQISLNNWKQNQGIFLTDKDLVEIDENRHFLPGQVGEAIRALANDVNDDIFAEYVGVYGLVNKISGVFGDTSTATQARKLLNQQLCPRNDRRGVLSYAAEANALDLQAFRDVSASSDRDVPIEGEIGRKFGIDWFADDGVPTHTAGTAAGDAGIAVDQADVAIGDTSVTFDVDADTNTFVIGDVFTVAGDTQQYVCTAGGTINTTGVAVAFSPAAKVAWADDAAVTFVASHEVNLVFHRDAFAYAGRPLVTETSGFALGSRIMSMQDPQTGLILRLEVSRQHKQVVWEFDILWGAKIVRPELAVRIAGPTS